MTRIKIFTFPVAIFIVGCSLTPTLEVMIYPTDWPPLELHQPTCNSISGVYYFHGENAQYSKNSVNSPTLFGLLGKPIQQEFSGVYIYFDADRTRLVLKATDLSGKEQKTYTTATCINGILVVRDTSEGYGDGTFSESKSTMILAKTTDGSLIARLQGSTKSKDLFFRWSHNYDVYYRFRMVK
jgi:hypothetical protein